MENPRKFKIFYNKHEHKYFNYQIKKKNPKNFIMQYYSSDFHYTHYFVVILHCSYPFSFIVIEIMQGFPIRRNS